MSMNDVAMHFQDNNAAINNGDQPPFPFLKQDCFAGPGDQKPGNAPRYFSNLRVNGIHNVDMNIYKSFVPKEGMKLDVRVEMFNFFNHPRFGQPNSSV